MADIGKALAALLRAGDIESLRLEATLKPKPVPPPIPERVPVVTLIVGAPRSKE